MQHRWRASTLAVSSLAFVSSVSLLVVGCSGGGSSSRGSVATAGASAAQTTTTTTTPATTASFSSPAPVTSAAVTPASPAPTTSPAAVADPEQPGPYTFAELDATVTVPASGDSVAFHAAYPTGGPTSGPYPVVVIGHGFLVDAREYYGYAQRLASFGFVAVTSGFPTPILGGSDQKYAEDLLGALDWAVAESASSTSALAGKVDAARCGAMGHSLGGKVALIAASLDPRIQAVLGLDPVDASSAFSTGTAIQARSRLPLPIVTCFLGETLDATGGLFGQSCAPAADNYDVLYKLAGSPSLEVTVAGAAHMTFVDDPASAGLAAFACKQPVASHDDVIRLARACTVAFFSRVLLKDARYDDYLVGASAQGRYVATGLATIDASRW